MEALPKEETAICALRRGLRGTGPATPGSWTSSVQDGRSKCLLSKPRPSALAGVFAVGFRDRPPTSTSACLAALCSLDNCTK